MPELSSPTIRVRLLYNEYTYTTPDDPTSEITGLVKREVTIPQELINNCQQTRTLTERGNSCYISFLDQNFNLFSILRNKALLEGGIHAPKELLELGEKSISSSSGNFSIPKDGTSGDELAKSIVAYCRQVGVNNPKHIGYILGTVEAETSMGKFLSEIGGESARYAPYFGRGLVQLTWKDNYQRFGDFFKRDWVATPDEVKKLEWAIPVLVGGMSGIRGCPTFSGYKLSDFDLSGGNFDWIDARQIVNGIDRASEIAEMGKRWLARLPELEGGGSKQSLPTVAQGGFAPAALVDKSTTNIKEKFSVADYAEKSIEIIIERGNTDSTEIVSTNFWYVEHSVLSMNPPVVAIRGQSVRFLMQAGTRSRVVERNISLRQIAKRLGVKFGIDTVVDPGVGAEKIMSKVQQNGEDDYKLLHTLANAVGYTLESTANPPQLKLKPIKKGNKATLRASWNATFTTRETADSSRVFKKLPAIDSLVDGKKIGEGFESSLYFEKPSYEILQLNPGMILSIPSDSVQFVYYSTESNVWQRFFNNVKSTFKFPPLEQVNKAFFREYVIKSISDTWTSGTARLSIELFIPVNIEGQTKTPEKTPDNTATKAGVPNISINWNDPNDRVSKFFFVKDVTNSEPARIPQSGSQVEKNVKILAAELDKVNEAWATKKGVDPKQRWINVTSWNRPSSPVNVNAAVGGAPNSQHIYGSAADIYSTIAGTDSEFEQWLDIVAWSSRALGYGVASGKQFTHLDLREGKIRWNY